MSEPWLDIVGLTEDGLAGLSSASLAAIQRAEIIFGGPRHLDLVNAGARGRAWPIPFDIEPVLAHRGKTVVVLTSGDPFWYGAGSSLAAHLDPSEFRALPAPSVFSLIAAKLGWALQDTHCVGLHDAPFNLLIPHLHQGTRMIVTLRDGEAVGLLGGWLTANGFGASTLHTCERIGGPQERIRRETASAIGQLTCDKLVACAIDLRGKRGLPRGFGLPDAAFASDGQITKRPIRAITLSTLAPRAGEVLWDLGAGSGSISVEWCLNGGLSHTVEQHGSRADNIRKNAQTYGQEAALTLHLGDSLTLLANLPDPDAVFIGGGASAALIEAVCQRLEAGARLVVNAVTLETEALVTTEQASRGGSLMKLEISEAEPLGRLRGWRAARPVVQWSFAA